jgi:integrase
MSVRKRTWTSGGTQKSSWVVDYADAQGKRRLKTFKLKKEADEFAKRAGVEVLDGLHVADSSTSTIEQAGRLWIRAGVDANLERTTLDQRRQHLNLHIVPFIGLNKLNKITVPFVQSFHSKLLENGRSPAMAKRVIVSLGSILANAQADGKTIRNAVHERTRSRSNQSKTQSRHKKKLEIGIDIPTNDEVRAIISAAEGIWRPFLIVAAFSGLRSSELRGLSWKNVDLQNGMVHVRQRADRYNVLGPPKTVASRRTVPLLPMAVDALNEWRSDCPKGDLELVFPTGEGNIEGHSNIVTRGFWPTQVAAGLAVPTKKVDADGQPVMKGKYSGLHSLRHWYASWCINRRVDGGLEMLPKQLQERLGHSNIAVTLDTYSHLFPSRNEMEELTLAQQAFFGAT